MSGNEAGRPPQLHATSSQDSKAFFKLLTDILLAFRDRGAGTTTNRTKPTDEAPRGTHRGGHHARVRGGRGSGHPRNRDDRHSKHFPR